MVQRQPTIGTQGRMNDDVTLRERRMTTTNEKKCKERAQQARETKRSGGVSCLNRQHKKYLKQAFGVLVVGLILELKKERSRYDTVKYPQ
jgi:hypothetical protein